MVHVDISGLNAPGVSFGNGVTSTGVIVGIDGPRQLLTVQLDIAINGTSNVTVSPDRVSVG
jgi:outer membrane receptor protein involved in Fe transport